jgi:hypothetical protein
MRADDPPARIVALNLHGTVIHSCFHSLLLSFTRSLKRYRCLPPWDQITSAWLCVLNRRWRLRADLARARFFFNIDGDADMRLDQGMFSPATLQSQQSLLLPKRSINFATQLDDKRLGDTPDGRLAVLDYFLGQAGVPKHARYYLPRGILDFLAAVDSVSGSPRTDKRPAWDPQQ